MRGGHRIEEPEAGNGGLRGLIHVDHLTGAMNRGGSPGFRRETAHADRHDTPLSIALIDIDNSKPSTTSMATSGATPALVHLSQIMMKSLRPAIHWCVSAAEEF